MKATRQTFISAVMLGVVIFTQSFSAWAGVASRNEVYISPGGTNVQGSLTGARYSADVEQYLECFIYSYTDGTSSPQSVVCGAKDKRGKTFSCFSTDTRILDAIKGMTDSSHLDITASAAFNGRCTDVTISNESIYLP